VPAGAYLGRRIALRVTMLVDTPSGMSEHRAMFNVSRSRGNGLARKRADRLVLRADFLLLDLAQWRCGPPAA